MITEREIAILESLGSLATSGPWHIREIDDEDCMGAVAISKDPPLAIEGSMRSGNWPGESIVAVCLLQSPPYAVIDDDKFMENARLICALRNNLSELLRLARLGVKCEADRS